MIFASMDIVKHSKFLKKAWKKVEEDLNMSFQDFKDAIKAAAKMSRLQNKMDAIPIKETTPDIGMTEDLNFLNF